MSSPPPLSICSSNMHENMFSDFDKMCLGPCLMLCARCSSVIFKANYTYTSISIIYQLSFANTVIFFSTQLKNIYVKLLHLYPECSYFVHYALCWIINTCFNVNIMFYHNLFKLFFHNFTVYTDFVLPLWNLATCEVSVLNEMLWI